MEILEHHKKILRQRLWGFEMENDFSRDEELKKLSGVMIVKHLTAWELGDSSWAVQIADWMVTYRVKPEDF